MSSDPILIWAECSVCHMPVHVHLSFLDAIAADHAKREHGGNPRVRFMVKP